VKPSHRLAIGIVLAGAGLASTPAVAFHIPDATGYSQQDLYLEVAINGLSRHSLLAVRQEDDGSWTAEPEELRKAGLLPAKTARRPDGRIDLNRLPGVLFTYDEPTQSLLITADPTARARLRIVAGAGNHDGAPQEPEVSYGGLLNYSLGINAGYTADQGNFYNSGVWGAFEARLFGPFGVVSNSFTTSADVPLAPHRGNTNWTYTNLGGSWQATAGDLATGSLAWTRATRLGGIQIQNDFGLRPDVVTYPVPGMSGSAALPSTAEVYVNGVERYSTQIPDGPFQLDDLPVSSGAGNAVLVVRDPSGHEVVTTQPYFVSSKLLRPGLLDYSAELGFARNFYGSDADQYDRRLMGSSSLRYGLTDWLTFEGHAEGGQHLLNAGIGADILVGSIGVATLAVTGSSAGGETGMQAFGSFGFEMFGTRVQLRSQRIFGAYNDIASITYPGTTTAGRAPKALDQVSVSLPLPIKPLRLSLNYTQLETADAKQRRLLGVGFNQTLWGGNLFTSGNFDIDSHAYGVSVGFSRAIGKDLRASAAMSAGSSGLNVRSSLSHSGGNDVGDVGWRLAQSGDATHEQLAGSIETRLPAASTMANLSYDGHNASGWAQLSGAVVATTGGVALAAPVNGAFAMVDAGYPNVPVLVQNHVVGRTGPDGKFVVTDLRPYQPNRIGIDATQLPLDAAVLGTQQQAVPAERSGAAISFGGGDAGGSALVTFVDLAGKVLDLGATGQISRQAPEFMVGYDGQAFVVGLQRTNRIILALPSGQSCVAEFKFKPEKGTQVSIPDVPCRPI
jgi:outer membrane usher protein